MTSGGAPKSATATEAVFRLGAAPNEPQRAGKLNDIVEPETNQTRGCR
jgi:hypothetical protein